MMSDKHNRHANAGTGRSIFILVAHGFEEEFTVSCLSRMRKVGLNVALVTFSSSPVTSLHGLRLSPDLSLAEAVARMPARMVILPGTAYAISALLTDPRVHRLLAATWAAGGIIAATCSAGPVLAEQGLLPEEMLSSVYIQHEVNVFHYVRQLIDLLLEQPLR
jgi:putative intracellular protease/amidase